MNIWPNAKLVPQGENTTVNNIICFKIVTCSIWGKILSNEGHAYFYTTK